MLKYKIYYVLRISLSALVLAALGFLVLWSSAYAVEAFDILLIAMGLFGIMGNLPPLLLSLKAFSKKQRFEWINLAVSLVGVLLGLALVFLHRGAAVLPVLLVIYAAALPLARVLLVAERAKQLSREMPKIAVGTFMLLVSLMDAESTMFTVLGVMLLVLAGLYLVGKLLMMRYYFKMD